MNTYTYGTTPSDVIEAALPHKYPMELTRNDMLSLLDALLLGDENAESLRSGILSTLDIEEV